MDTSATEIGTGYEFDGAAARVTQIRHRYDEREVNGSMYLDLVDNEREAEAEKEVSRDCSSIEERTV